MQAKEEVQITPPVWLQDIVGFTSLAARISPEESMRHLNHM
jgi:hypothetical protein